MARSLGACVGDSTRGDSTYPASSGYARSGAIGALPVALGGKPTRVSSPPERNRVARAAIVALVKGSVTVDPDGYPLVYTGSRDGFCRVIALDRDPPAELWSLPASAVRPTMWNDDWDSSALVVDGYLLEGGENSQWHAVELRRSYGSDGRVIVDPRLAFHAPGWDDELLRDLGDRQVSIEGSLALFEGVAYFANSGGLVQGWDVSGLAEGRPPTRVFRFWTGDDTDATVVVDDRGMRGRLLGLDKETGAVRWERQLPGPTWQSPTVVDDVLIMGDCHGVLHDYDVSDTAVVPPELWSVRLGGCIESTPAVWGGRIYLDTRSGFLYALGDRAN